MASLWHVEDPRWRTLDKWFVAALFVLFAYSLCAWRGVLGIDPGWRPLHGVFISGALLLQAVGNLARRQSRTLWLFLVLASLAALGFGVAAT